MGYKLTPEQKLKQSIALRLAFKEGRKKAVWKGKKLSEEHRRKMSLSHKGKKNSPEHNEAISKAKAGVQHPHQRGEKHYLWKGGTDASKKRRAEHLRKNGGSHSIGEWETCKAQYNWCCIICGMCEPEITLTKDHIIPVSRGGSNNIENIMPLCGTCNSRKNNRILKEA